MLILYSQVPCSREQWPHSGKWAFPSLRLVGFCHLHEELSAALGFLLAVVEGSGVAQADQGSGVRLPLPSGAAPARWVRVRATDTDTLPQRIAGD